MTLFGTDGIRGCANTPPMTPDIMMKVAMAAGHIFHNGTHRHTVVIGKDTRLSGYMIEFALTSGFIAMGMNVVLVGPLPTPAISMLVQSLRADLGVMVSASHNPFQDNGVKFFGPDGFKLCSETEHQIESLVKTGVDTLADPKDLGRAIRLEGASGRYIEFVKNTLPKSSRFDGLKIVIDCAHGAAYTVAPKVLTELGATVISIGDQPDGININDGYGATATDNLSQAVQNHQADIGIALDGDADRVVICDETGHIVDGDQIMALIATFLNDQGRLRNNTVVGTVMSNLGLEVFLQSQGFDFMRTAVGDRPVAEYMRKNGCNVGGEQSGHIILSDFAKTGDGLMAALQVLSVVVEAREQKNLKASQVCHKFSPVPQKLVNLPLTKEDPMASQTFLDKVNTIKLDLENKGRILVRKSGTEPLIRLMVEHHDLHKIDPIMHQMVTQLIKEGFVSQDSLAKIPSPS